jgi:uncharacterized protein (TIGR02246 family)
MNDMTGTNDFAIAECAVRQLHARYIDAIWRKDFESFGDCFTTDCEWLLSSGAVLRGRDATVAGIKANLARFKGMLVTLRTPMVAIEKDGSLSSRVYLTEQAAFLDGKAYGAIGTYYERIVNQGGHWRVKWRLSQAHYNGPLDLSGPFVDNADWGAPPAMPPLDGTPPKR